MRTPKNEVVSEDGWIRQDAVSRDPITCQIITFIYKNYIYITNFSSNKLKYL